MKTVKLDSKFHADVIVSKPKAVNTNDMDNIDFLDYLCESNALIIFDDGYRIEAQGQARRDVISSWIASNQDTFISMITKGYESRGPRYKMSAYDFKKRCLPDRVNQTIGTLEDSMSLPA